MSIESQIYNLNRAAEFLGCSPPTLRKKIKEGEWIIPELDMDGRRFHKSDLESFIASRKVAVND